MWHSNAEDLLGLRDTAHYTFPDQPALFAALTTALGPNVEPLNSWIRDHRLTPQSGPHDKQHWWTEQIGSHTKARLLRDSNPRDAIRLSQTIGPGSSGWMAAPPSPSLGLTFDSSTYRVLLRWHLGIPLVPASLEGAACPLGCGTTVDTFGDHMVCCRKNKAWERHLGIQSYLSRCLQSSAIPHRREQSAAGDLKRDADILIPSWEAGRGLAIDVGIAHPYPPGQDHSTVSAAATILSNRCLRKDTKYSERCTSAGFSFRPLVQSTWGAFAPSCHETWTELVRRMAAHRGGPSRSLLVEEIHQGLSHALMRGVGKQLRSLLMTQEYGYQAAHSPRS
jgi:hypothetical protein